MFNLPKMFSQRKQKGIVGTLITAFVLVPIVLAISFLVYTGVGNNIDQSGFTAGQNTTLDKIKSNTETGFKLGANLPTVLAASAIIGVIIGAFAVLR